MSAYRQGQSASEGSSLAATAVYPLPSYPGREEEGLLGQLLRKKLEVGVEEWVESGRDEGQRIFGPSSSIPNSSSTVQSTAAADHWRRLWEWAGIEANGVAREYDWGGDLDGDDEDDAEDADEEMDEDGVDAGKTGSQVKAEETVKGKPMSLDDMMRFMAKGTDGIS